MGRADAIEQIRKSCNAISRELMAIHPAVPGLGDKETQDAIFKTLFELTSSVETIKKQLAKLERRDDTAEL